jgi:hypothetical protein
MIDVGSLHVVQRQEFSVQQENVSHRGVLTAVATPSRFGLSGFGVE